MFGTFRKQIQYFVDCKYIFVPKVSVLNTGQRPVKGYNEQGENTNIYDHKLFRKFVWYGPMAVVAKTNDESKLFAKKKNKRNLKWKTMVCQKLISKLGKTDTRQKRPFFSLVACCSWALGNRRTILPQIIQFLEISLNTRLRMKKLSSTLMPYIVSTSFKLKFGVLAFLIISDNRASLVCFYHQFYLTQKGYITIFYYIILSIVHIHILKLL